MPPDEASEPLFAPAPDAILQRRSGKWLFSNPRARTHALLDARASEAVARLGGGEVAEGWRRALEGASGWDATEDFFGERGLHADHTGFREGVAGALRSGELFDLLRRRWLLLEEGSGRYREYFGPLSSVLDREHMGTFHQRVGQYLTVARRLRSERWRWWQDQKFTADGLQIRDGPYKSVQEAFIKDRFSGAELKGKRVLDFGCGNGFYSAFFSGSGASVCGVDTSSELIALARRNHAGKAEFLHFDSAPAELAWLKGRADEFDLVFMQDILLLLLRPEDGRGAADVDGLLRALHGALRPEGSLCMMEPNPVFWLASRYGDPARPYAVVTEYRRPLFNVAPALPEIMERLAGAGFGLAEYAHPAYRPEGSSPALEKAYAEEYPIWDFMRFKPFGR